MNAFWQTHKKPLTFALLLHVLLLIALCLNWQLNNANVPALQAGPIVQATLIEQSAPAKVPPAKPIIPPQPQPKPALPPKAVESKPISVPPKPIVEKSVPEKAVPEKPAIVEKPAEIAIAKPKVKPKPDIKKMENDLAAALDKEQKEMTKQKQAQQRAKQKTDLEKQLQQQLAADEPKVSSATTQTQITMPAAATISSGEIDKYRAMILAAIGQHWIVPPDVGDKSCQFLIHLAPGGIVLDVKLLKSSGDPAMDRSARAAVFKASPLPVPTDNASFDAFRELNLTVHPKST